MRTFACLFLCGCAAWAQSAEEPQAIGYLFDVHSGQPRTIAGTPGAARMVASAAGQFVVAAVHARTGLLVGCTAADAALTAYASPSSEPVAIKDARTGADRIALSANASAAAASFGRAGIVQVIAGFPAAPAVSREIPVDPNVPITALAVSDDGKAVAAAAANGVTVFRGDAGGVLLPLTPSDMRFVGASHDLLLVDNNAGVVLLYAEGSDTPEILASTNDGIDHPTTAYLSADRKHLIVGTATSVLLRDRNAGTSTAIGVPAQTKMMDPLVTPGLYAFRAGASEPVWLLDTTGSVPKTWFVPAPRVAQPIEVAK